ncbi:MAG TPA: TetR/AcrR family transcriptional regulator [Solirubrobacterales bacterium]|nr:TetR/AcrR family transcriptional regulator [Solirubrobacterales bacterium]
MTQRAAAAAETRQRIVDAAIELSLEHWYDEITLRQIAAAAGVALQTVVNHFGTKEGILTAVLEQPIPAEMMTRTAARPGDTEEAVRLLAHDYELAGDGIFRSLALEQRIVALQPFLERGRREHRAWVERTFPAALAELRGAERGRRLDLLVCATDVLTWKLLRRDRGLSQGRTREAMREMVEALHR